MGFELDLLYSMRKKARVDDTGFVSSFAASGYQQLATIVVGGCAFQGHRTLESPHRKVL